MARMTDPTDALTSFQQALITEGLHLQPGAIDPVVLLYVDKPTGTPRFTYVTLDGETVTALAILAHVDPYNKTPCFHLGYAVPKRFRGQGRAKALAGTAIAELSKGMKANGVPSFYVEAVVGKDNAASIAVAAATFPDEPASIIDELSGSPAWHYLKKI